MAALLQSSPKPQFSEFQKFNLFLIITINCNHPPHHGYQAVSGKFWELIDGKCQPNVGSKSEPDKKLFPHHHHNMYQRTTNRSNLKNITFKSRLLTGGLILALITIQAKRAEATIVMNQV